MTFCMAGNLHKADYRPMSETLHKTQVGRRLRDAIKVLGISQTEVGKDLGASPSKIGNWIRGDHYPSEWFVKQFCDRYGITTEWIYRGIVTGMAKRLADPLWNMELSASAKDPAPEPPQRLTPRKERSPPRPTPGGSVAASDACEVANVVRWPGMPA
jgi:transcriptional regulator with XRE-family HTH domain